MTYALLCPSCKVLLDLVEAGLIDLGVEWRFEAVC